jgi:pimeloyl-ACP methyl ester carboxylesterase
VFLINGFDPIGVADFRGVACQLQSAGLWDVRYRQFPQAAAVGREIRRLRREDPGAPVALVGYSAGANVANRLAQQAARDGAPVELLIFVDPVVMPGFTFQPCSAGRTVNVASPHPLLRSPTLPGACNVLLPPTGHYSVPTHPVTVGVLFQELAGLAGPARP